MPSFSILIRMLIDSILKSSVVQILLNTLRFKMVLLVLSVFLLVKSLE